MSAHNSDGEENYVSDSESDFNDTEESGHEKCIINGKEVAIHNEKMRVLLTKAIDLKEASERGDITCIHETAGIITEADKVLSKAKCSSTAYLDAQVIYNTSLTIKNNLEKMDSRMSKYGFKEFAENILSYLGNKTRNRNIWSALEDEAALVFNNTGGWTWQLGSLNIEETPQAQRQQRAKRDDLVNAPIKNPKKVQNLEKEEEDLGQHMQSIMTILFKWERENKEPLQFWQLVLNPTSFSETVENIFHVSHLVKEGLVNVCMDRLGLPFVKAARKASKTEEEVNAVAVTIDMKEWKDLIDAFEIKQSMIPNKSSIQCNEI